MAAREEGRRTTGNAAHWAIGAGIGSAAILAGLLYANRLRKASAESRPARLPEDLPEDGNTPEAPEVRRG